MTIEERASLDSKDLKIISMLCTNPEVSQEEIAKHVRLSQPAIGMRIKKLVEQGVLYRQCGLNLKRTGLYLGKVDISTRNINGVLKKFESCPLFLNGFITSGTDNLCLLLMSENLSSLQSMITHHLKEDPTVRGIEDSVIISTSKHILYTIDSTSKKTPKAPCGSSCETCTNYNLGDCLGCPSTTSYRGKFLK
jgi:Lrp/AsnC family leucine-responsive transcriptional regulator